jgi:hypothetical protein
MAFGFTFKVELEDGTPADPPTFRSAPGVSWRAGDTIPLGRGGTLRVIDSRLDEGTKYGERPPCGFRGGGPHCKAGAPPAAGGAPTSNRYPRRFSC